MNEGDTDYGTWVFPVLFQRVSATETVGITGIIERAAVTQNEIRGTMNGDVLLFGSNLASPDGRPPGVCRASDHVIVFRRP